MDASSMIAGAVIASMVWICFWPRRNKGSAE